MRHRARVLCLASAVGGFLLLFSFSSAPISFARLDDAKIDIEAKGFHCIPDSAKTIPGNGFLVAREEVPRQRVRELCKVGKLGPQWEGKVWITLSPRQFPLATLPEDAPVRQWGRVIAFGDGALLDELELKLQRTRLRSMLG